MRRLVKEARMRFYGTICISVEEAEAMLSLIPEVELSYAREPAGRLRDCPLLSPERPSGS